MKAVLAIDQGTTGTTVSVIEKNGQPLFKVNEEFEQIFPQPGWVEHNSEHIWNSVLSCLEKALESAPIKGSEIAAIGNLLRHEYQRVDDLIMWKIASRSLPDLRAAISDMLRRECR